MQCSGYLTQRTMRCGNISMMTMATHHFVRVCILGMLMMVFAQKETILEPHIMAIRSSLEELMVRLNHRDCLRHKKVVWPFIRCLQQHSI